MLLLLQQGEFRSLWIVSILVLIVAITFIWRDLKVGGSHLEGDSEASDNQLDTRPSP